MKPEPWVCRGALALALLSLPGLCSDHLFSLEPRTPPSPPAQMPSPAGSPPDPSQGGLRGPAWTPQLQCLPLSLWESLVRSARPPLSDGDVLQGRAWLSPRCPGSSREAQRQPLCQEGGREKRGPRPQAPRKTLVQGRGWLMTGAGGGSRGQGWAGVGWAGSSSGCRARGCELGGRQAGRSYQLEDAHGLCVVLRWQPRERRPQGRCEHPKGRFLGAQGGYMGTEPGLRGPLDPPLWVRWAQESGKQGPQHEDGETGSERGRQQPGLEAGSQSRKDAGNSWAVSSPNRKQPLPRHQGLPRHAGPWNPQHLMIQQQRARS